MQLILWQEGPNMCQDIPCDPGYEYQNIRTLGHSCSVGGIRAVLALMYMSQSLSLKLTPL